MVITYKDIRIETTDMEEMKKIINYLHNEYIEIVENVKIETTLTNNIKKVQDLVNFTKNKAVDKTNLPDAGFDRIEIRCTRQMMERLYDTYPSRPSRAVIIQDAMEKFGISFNAGTSHVCRMAKNGFKFL